jgi:hypothetical protein
VPGKKVHVSVLLVAIVIVAALLRGWHHDYDLGNDFTYDTADKVRQAQAVAAGHLVPRNWVQPYFLPYSGGLLLALAGLADPARHDDAERLLTLYMIALSVATVALVHFLARRAWGSAGIGLGAAAILAVVPISVVGARYIKEDTPLMFWTSVALLALVRLVDRGRPRDHLLAGLAVGWTLGTKYSALMVLAALAAALVLRARGGQRAWPWSVVAVAAVPVGVLMFNPCLLTHFRELSSRIPFLVGYASGGHHDGTVVSPWPQLWTFYLRHAVLPGVTLPVTIAALAGAIATVRRRPRRAGALLLLGWAVADYLVFEASGAKPFPFFARYLHPMIPVLAALAAVGVAGLGQWSWRAAVPAIVAWPLARSLLITAAIADDTRLMAARWIDSNLPPATIWLDDPHYAPHPDARRFRLRWFGLTTDRIYDQPPVALVRDNVRYVVLDSFKSERFAIAARGSAEAARASDYYQSLLARHPVIHEVRPRFAFQSYGFHNPVITIVAVR